MAMKKTLDQNIIDDVNFGTTMIEFCEYLKENDLTYNEWANEEYSRFYSLPADVQQCIIERNEKVNEEKCKEYSVERAWNLDEEKFKGWA